MSTHRSIVDALSLASESDEAVILATVVRVTGSSYGGVGTRMVIRADGTTVGIVSGGCLESDLAEHARDVHRSGKARVVTYDTRADDDAAWGLGLGCNGLIDVLLEPLDATNAGAVAVLLEQGFSGNSPSVLLTVIDAPDSDASASIGAHALIGPEEIETTGNWGDRAILSRAAMDADGAFAERRRGLVREYDEVTVAFEVVNPVIRLVLCGSGPDGVPLVKFGVDLGWNVTVVDHRSVEHSHPERFPGARVAECREAVQLAESLSLSSSTAAVVMSHNFARDTDYVRALLDSPVAYIGVLGPRARAERMLADISSQGVVIEAGDRLFAPIGIDIATDGPDGIALSIIAEVSAVLGGRHGGHLRDRRGPLHGSTTVSTAKV
jgi:xanthine/CO dehydrogenase XdhC/CoxF family maturation factor